MTSTRHQAHGRVALLIVMAALLSVSFAWIKIALTGFTPLQLVSVRLWVAAVALAPWLLPRASSSSMSPPFSPAPAPPGLPLPLVAIGLLSTAVPYLLLALAERNLEAGRTGVLFASGPLVAGALLTLVGEDDRPGPLQVGALAIGACGVFLALPVGDPGATGGVLYAAGAVLAYAVSGALFRRHLGPHAPVRVLAVSVAIGAVASTVVAVVEGAPIDASGAAWSAAAGLGLLSTALAIWLRFVLTQRAGYGFVSWAGYLVPVFSLGWAHVLVGEHIDAHWIGGLALILTGLFLNVVARRAGAETWPPGVRSRERL